MEQIDFSAFRLVGLIAGFVIVAIGVRALRRVSAFGPGALFMIAGGAAVAATALFPGIATILTDVLQIGRYPGSRLLALLIIAVFVLGVAVMALLAQTAKGKEQLDRLIRHVAITDFVATRGDIDFARDTILAILPALNEEKNIAGVLARMPQTIEGRRVVSLVVDDGSTDATGAVAQANGAQVLRSPFQRGGGAAIRLGFEAAERAGAAVAVNIDADGQNDPQEMERLVRPILNQEADLVIGSRILGSHEITVWWRHVGVLLFSALYNFLLGQKITDISSGYRAIRVDKLRLLRLRQDQYHTSEFLVMCAKLNFRIAEAPIRFSRRVSGKSKKGNEVLYGLRFARALLTAWMRGA